MRWPGHQMCTGTTKNSEFGLHITSCCLLNTKSLLILTGNTEIMSGLWRRTCRSLRYIAPWRGSWKPATPGPECSSPLQFCGRWYICADVQGKPSWFYLKCMLSAWLSVRKHFCSMAVWPFARSSCRLSVRKLPSKTVSMLDFSSLLDSQKGFFFHVIQFFIWIFMFVFKWCPT